MRDGNKLTTLRRAMIAAAVLLTSLNVCGSDIKIIANGSVKMDSISAHELRSVFLLQRRTLTDGSSAVPVLKTSGADHELFLKQYLDRSSDEMRIYYQGLVFTGKGSVPKQFNSDAEVVAYVAKTKGAIGYVSADTPTAGVKILVVAVAGGDSERILITRVEPAYPETLKQRDIGGIVRLRVTISAKGNVERVELLGGNPILAEAAESAVKQWVYASSHSQSVAEVSLRFESHP